MLGHVFPAGGGYEEGSGVAEDAGASSVDGTLCSFAGRLRFGLLQVTIRRHRLDR